MEYNSFRFITYVGLSRCFFVHQKQLLRVQKLFFAITMRHLFLKKLPINKAWFFVQNTTCIDSFVVRKKQPFCKEKDN